MTFAPVSVSNTVLKRAKAEGIDISPMKLQKILYFLASEYYKETGGKPLFPELFQAWKFGPVLYSVYSEFKNNGSSPISNYGKDSSGKSYVVRMETSPNFAACFDRVWKASKYRTAAQLSRITHSENSAWYDVFTEGEKWISDEAVGADSTYLKPLRLGSR